MASEQTKGDHVKLMQEDLIGGSGARDDGGKKSRGIISDGAGKLEGHSKEMVLFSGAQDAGGGDEEDDIIDADLEDLGFEVPEKWMAVAWYFSGFSFSVPKLFQEMSKAWGIQDAVPTRDLGGNRERDCPEADTRMRFGMELRASPLKRSHTREIKIPVAKPPTARAINFFGVHKVKVLAASVASVSQMKEASPGKRGRGDLDKAGVNSRKDVDMEDIEGREHSAMPQETCEALQARINQLQVHTPKANTQLKADLEPKERVSFSGDYNHNDDSSFEQEVNSMEAMHHFNLERMKWAGGKFAAQANTQGTSTMEIDEHLVVVKEEPMTESEIGVELDGDACAQLLLLLWRAWFARNEIVHGSPMPSVQASVSFLSKYWLELCVVSQDTHSVDLKGKRPVVYSMQKNTRRFTRRERQMREPSKWEPPPEGWIKINVDGGFDKDTGKAGIGIVIRDAYGQALLCSWRALFRARDAEETEAVAATEGLRLAVEWNPEKAILESDCASVIQAFKCVANLKSGLSFIVREGIETSNSLPQLRLSLAKREQNRVAHTLAQLAKQTCHTAVWRLQAPVCVEPMLATSILE
ncbi:hypothetical protein PR202_gb14497 [Eleusine coracana subsp. coracana]|uniref:RNase H type-1 domain-containing protein n=1 Tax=Eleusine coracana subsp. coracana TaxID=191504 RepID=A0AAV5EVT4_ELECO|nr:hypothetical protein PR202_gb14497 [Eleusine coracana subsp. coracana]